MKKRPRSQREQAVATARVAAAVQLQAHRPQVHESPKIYNRNKQKRLWQKDQEALHAYIGPCYPYAPIFVRPNTPRANMRGFPGTPHPISDRAAA